MTCCLFNLSQATLIDNVGTEMKGTLCFCLEELEISQWRRLVSKPASKSIRRSATISVDVGAVGTQKKHSLLRCGLREGFLERVMLDSGV